MATWGREKCIRLAEWVKHKIGELFPLPRVITPDLETLKSNADAVIVEDDTNN